MPLTFKGLSQTRILRYRYKELLFLFTTLINIVDVLLNICKWCARFSTIANLN